MATRREVEWLIAGVSLAGWLYIALKIYTPDSISWGGCLFRRFTTINCPACGTTRAMQELLHGNFGMALSINPLVYIQALFLVAAPVLLLLDKIMQRDTTYRLYTSTCNTIAQSRWLQIILIATIITNWIYVNL